MTTDAKCLAVLDRGPLGEEWNYPCELEHGHDGWHRYETAGIIVTWAQ